MSNRTEPVAPNPTPDPAASRGPLTVLALLGAWTGVLCVWLYGSSIVNGGMACWDGYDRCAWGASLWAALEAGDLALFWDQTHFQVVWPFLHSWITAGLFYLFGPTLETARLIALASYWSAACLILAWVWRHARKRDVEPDLAAVGAMAAWALFATAPAVLEHAASVMSELPGFALVMASLAALPRDDEARPRAFLASAFFLGLLFYFKYNFAGLTYIGLFIARAFQARLNPRALIDPRNLVLFGAPLLMFALWLAPHFRAKIEGFIYFAVNNPEVRMPFSWDSVMYYPRLIPQKYVAHSVLLLLAVPLIGLRLLAGPRLKLSNPVLTCFAVHFAAAMAHPMKDPRFVFIPMALFYVLAGDALALSLRGWSAPAFAARRRRAFAAACVIAAAVMVYQRDLHRMPHSSIQDAYRAPVFAILDQISPDDRVAFLVSHDLVNPPALNFYLTSRFGLAQNPMNGERFRWKHYYLFEKRADALALDIEERFKALRHEFYLEEADTVVTLQSTAPYKIARFDDLFGGAHEYANLVPYMGEFELVFERTFFKTDALLRVFRLKRMG